MPDATLFTSSGPALFSIDVHQPFSDALVDGILAHTATQPMVLARGIILLPNNRAIDAVRSAFIRRADHGILLPQLAAIGDLNLETDVSVGRIAPPGLLHAALLDIAAVIDPFERTMILAREIQRIYLSADSPIDAAAATTLAKSLASTLDEMQIYRKSVADIRTMPHKDLQTHWQRSLIILEILWNAWPDILGAQNKVDLVTARNTMLDSVAHHWRTVPPVGFVIAAGITTIAPAVTGLLRTILAMKHGAVVLAGVDFDMPDAHWDVLRPMASGDVAENGLVAPNSKSHSARRPLERHPQFAANALLNALDMQRGDVMPWISRLTLVSPLRRELASRIFVPAQFSNEWATVDLKQAMFDGLSAIELANPAAEAQAIAIMMRETIQHPGKTAALVTPDRALAERVSAHLARWGISADDSAGQPLLLRPHGDVMLSLAKGVATHWAPVETIAFLSNPLVRGGIERRDWLDNVRILDRLLRGPRPAPRLSGIRTRIENIAADPEKFGMPKWLAQQAKDILIWWASVAAMLAPLEDFAATVGAKTDDNTLAKGILAMQNTIEQFCGADIWAGAEGRVLAARLSSWIDIAPSGPNMHQIDILPDLVQSAFGDVRIRKAFGGHPRLFIWGVLEARLQTADRIILGGLNEGVWPKMLASDPWLPPVVRKTLGLPGIESQIGLSAQDFVGAFSAPEVIMTRAIRDATAPTIASRFWLRLQALAGTKLPKTTQGIDFAALSRGIDVPQIEDRVRIMAPAPNPAASLRPKKINVTDVDLLQVDPFAFYAKNILKLSRLGQLNEDPGAAWRGTAVHDILEKWANARDWNTQKLLARAQQLLDDPAIDALTRTMWTPKLHAAMNWVAATVKHDVQTGRVPFIVEEKKTIMSGGIDLTGKPDRIDQMPDGTVVIVDYKSGSGQPKPDARKGGYALQLGLLAHMAEHGAFQDTSLVSSAMEYWMLGRRNTKVTGEYGGIDWPYGTNKSKGYDHIKPDTFPDFAATRLAIIAKNWLLGSSAFLAKVRPQHCVNSDYDHVMRYLEWYGRTTDDTSILDDIPKADG